MEHKWTQQHGWWRLHWIENKLPLERWKVLKSSPLHLWKRYGRTPSSVSGRRHRPDAFLFSHTTCPTIVSVLTFCFLRCFRSPCKPVSVPFLCTDCGLELSSSYDISNIEDSDATSCTLLKKPLDPEYIEHTTFNATSHCQPTPSDVTLEVTLTSGTTCDNLVDLFFMYHDLNVTCYPAQYTSTCTLLSAPYDTTLCSLECSCDQHCYGAVILSAYTKFPTLNVCRINAVWCDQEHLSTCVGYAIYRCFHLSLGIISYTFIITERYKGQTHPIGTAKVSHKFSTFEVHRESNYLFLGIWGKTFRFWSC